MTPKSVAPSVLVVTGPPAAGKTTLARLLATRRPLSCHLHADDFWAHIVTGYIDPWLPAANRQNDVVLTAVCGAAADFARGGYSVVLDGVLGPWFLPTLAKSCPYDEINVDYVILMPSLDRVLANLSGRTGHGFTSAEAAAKMHAEFEGAISDYDRHVFDPGDLTPDDLADRVDADQSAGRLRLAS